MRRVKDFYIFILSEHIRRGEYNFEIIDRIVGFVLAPLQPCTNLSYRSELWLTRAVGYLPIPWRRQGLPPFWFLLGSPREFGPQVIERWVEYNKVLWTSHNMFLTRHLYTILTVFLIFMSSLLEVTVGFWSRRGSWFSHFEMYINFDWAAAVGGGRRWAPVKRLIALVDWLFHFIDQPKSVCNRRIIEVFVTSAVFINLRSLSVLFCGFFVIPLSKLSVRVSFYQWIHYHNEVFFLLFHTLFLQAIAYQIKEYSASVAILILSVFFWDSRVEL